MTRNKKLLVKAKARPAPAIRKDPITSIYSTGTTQIKGYRAVVIAYAALGMVLTLVFARLSSATEVGASEDRSLGLAAKKTLLGIGHSREIVLKLSGLFALDSFGGGFVVQSFAAY